MAYKIVHGELGYDIMKDGHIVDLGYRTREAARQEISELLKHEAALAAANVAVTKLLTALHDDYGLSTGEISVLFKQDTKR